MKIVLVPKLTNPMTCRFFEPRYAFDLGVLTIGTYVQDKAEVSIKSIFGHRGQKFLNPADILRLARKSYLSDFTGYLLSDRPNVVGFSTMDSSLVNTIVAARAIKEQDAHVKIILGGPGVFFNYSDILENFPFIDFCLRGEGEVGFDRFVDYLQGAAIAESVPGLVFRQNGVVKVNSLATPLDVDQLPFLSYALYDSRPESLMSISCEPGRGCPFNCTFCTTTAFWSNRYRVKSPARLAEEVDHYCNLFPHIDHFDFHSHDNFLKSRTYIRLFGEELAKRNLSISWNCSSRIDLLDDEFIEILAQSGCNYIDCGIESGSARIRQLIKKNIDIDKTLSNTKKLLSKNIGVATNFMFGFPTETLAEAEETFEMACRCDSMDADIVFCFLSPLKGTAIHAHYPDLLVTKHDDGMHDFNDTGVNFLHGTEDLRRENEYFIHQIKMFLNDKRYNRIVKKIRAVDSVYIFSHYSDILLQIKENLKIDIYEIKSALKEFPYSGDLFSFLERKFRAEKIRVPTFVDFVNSLLQIQQKTNQKSRTQIEDITLFLSMSHWLSRQPGLDSVETTAFVETCIRQFFSRTIGVDLYEILKNIIGIDLSAAYFVRPRSELFLKFEDCTIAQGGILVGIRFDRQGVGKLRYYKKQLKAVETKLLQTIVKVINGKFNGNRHAANQASAGL